MGVIGHYSLGRTIGRGGFAKVRGTALLIQKQCIS